MNYEKAIRTGMAHAGIRTQKELSERTGITPAALSRILAGKTRAPSAATVQKLALAFNVPAFKIYTWGEYS